MLASVCVVCTECGAHVRRDAYSEHVESACQIQSTVSSQDSPDTSIGEILGRATSTPLTPVEVRLQSRLVKRSLAQKKQS